METEDRNRSLPVWVLSLESSSPRRSFMAEQLARVNLPFEFVSAVDGSMLSTDQTRLYSRKDALRCSGRELSNGEIGCALSHAEMWQRMLREGHDEVVILEDDVFIGDMFLRILERRNSFPLDWDLINFVTDAPQIPFGNPIHDIYRLCRFEGYANRTGAYLLNRRGAQKLLDHTFPLRWPADGLTGRTYITGIAAYGIEPKILSLNNFESEIWRGSDFRRLKTSYKSKIHAGMRRMINAVSFVCLGNQKLER